MKKGNPNPSPGTRFGKGNRRGGRAKGLLRAEDIKKSLAKYWRFTKSELREVLEDEASTMGDLMVASIMARVVKEGDAHRFGMLLDRAIGRVRPEAEEPGEDQAGGGKVDIGKLSAAELADLEAKTARELAAARDRLARLDGPDPLAGADQGWEGGPPRD